uniref:Titin n=1 Tax=Denticeps clupeoides TaxID=299321 RepID=A0AAY4EXT6_9TELE
METDSVKMICEVSKASAEVTWYKGDQELPEGGRYEQIQDGRKRILLIKELRMDDAGEYNCKLPASKTSFISRPKSQEVVEGEKAEFMCSVSKDTYEVKWLKGDKELASDDKYEIVCDGKKRGLIVKNCGRDDEGGYVAIIGSIKYSKSKFIISIITPLKESKVNEGQEVVLNCEVNTEDAKAKWLKNEETMFESSKFIMVQKDNVFSLRIKDAQKSDEGNYTVILTNQRGEQAKSSAKLTIQEKKTVTFSCKVNKPNATLKWMKAGQELTFNKRIVYRVDKDKHTLTIKECLLGDEGEYSVFAGADKSTAELIISEAPTDFTTQLSDQTITEFEDAEFTCQLSKEKAEVKWYRNGREIREGPSISECTRNHTGIYLLTVSNSAGSKTVALNITVLDVPAPPIGPVNVLEVTPDCMLIEWRPPKDDGGSPVMNYIVEKRESNKETWGGVSSGSTSTKLKIPRLQKGAEYIVRIRAENKIGIGAPLESAPTVARHMFEPPAHPGKPSVSDLSEDALTVGWTIPLSDGGSPISGYIIERRHKGGKWIRVNKTPCKELRYRVLGLFEGNDYEFRVFAENIAGFSSPSPISDPARPTRPITIPGPPTPILAIDRIEKP